MNKKDDKEITISELLNSMNRSFSRIEEKMATKEELKQVEVKMNREFSRIEERMATKEDLEQVRVDLRDFKSETRENFDKVNRKIDDVNDILEDVVSNHESCIEVLEEKVLT